MTKTTPKKNSAAQALGRLGGSKNTAAQNAARAQNAQRAGRPRRVCTRCGEPVIGGHVDRELDGTCGPSAWRWQQRDSKLTPAELEREIESHYQDIADLERQIVRSRMTAPPRQRRGK